MNDPEKQSALVLPGGAKHRPAQAKNGERAQNIWKAALPAAPRVLEDARRTLQFLNLHIALSETDADFRADALEPAA